MGKITINKGRFVAVTLAVLAACARSGGERGDVLPQDSMTGPAARTPRGPIAHVVVIVQENRSFDNLFAGFPGADAPTTGLMHNGRRISLRHITMANTPDVVHGYGTSLKDYDAGKMDGFNLGINYSGKPVGRLAYSYVERSIVAPYWSMAKQYTLADAMFPTEHGASWTAHLDLITTTNLSPSTALVDYPSAAPWDCLAPKGTVTPTIDSGGNYNPSGGPYPCFTRLRTMADTLDAAGLSWRFYAPKIFESPDDLGGEWSPFGAIRKVRRGGDWSNVISPPSKILTDIAQGYLANVTWITPEFNYSDHAGGGTDMGPSWVAAVVNAIGESRFWKHTALIVLWDDWGGWYDDAIPPQLDFKGLGIRVPCIIISPYVKQHHVSHTQYEFGSVLRFVEEVFHLPLLGTADAGYSDARATSLGDTFDFTQVPIKFAPISAPYPPTTFLRMPESGKAPDDE